MRKTTMAAVAAGLMLASAAPALAQDTSATTMTAPATTVEESDDGFDMGWLGLLGLAGLLGLRRKPVATVDTTTRRAG